MTGENAMFNIEEELKKLPAQPGVYIMHDAKDEIIYVGKAISLKNRVRQYFQSSRNKTAKIEQMVSRIARFEYIVTDSELEALVLECNLIKEHRPRYNTMLKDDKSYPYIKVTVGEDFPRVLFSRTMKKDKSKYFGPYTSAGAVKDTIELVRKIYRIRTCNRSLPRDIGKERPCLNYHIKQCDAPCQGYISREEYRESVNQVLEFLNGRYEPVLKMLEEKMLAFSEQMEFEKAIEYRELLSSVKKIAQKQKITSQSMEDRDIIALARDERDAVVQVFFVREGNLIGRDHFHIRIATAEDDGQILSSFVKQFYSGTPFIPRELWVQAPLDDEEIIGQWLAKPQGPEGEDHRPPEGAEGASGGAGPEKCGAGALPGPGAHQERGASHHRRHEPGGRMAGTHRHPPGGGLRYLQYQRLRVGGLHGGVRGRTPQSATITGNSRLNGSREPTTTPPWTRC